MDNSKIKLSFENEPKFCISTSKATGKLTTICCLLCVLRIPGANASIPHEVLFAMGDEHAFYAFGKAVCNENDIPNEEIGKKVALANAERKAYSKAIKLANKYAAKMRNLSEQALASVPMFVDKANNVMKHNSEYVNCNF